jgi:hypothetical protein
MLEQLNPVMTIKARVEARIVAPPYWDLDTQFEPIMAAPEFPAPMYKPLAELSQDLILPGLEHVPPNIITLLETNPRFVEAYMVGLNHGMSRELLWRDVPIDQRWTFFRQFWDPRGQVPPPTTATKDIEPITERKVWKDSNRLGENMKGGGAQGQSALLIRGDLLRRYPRAIIYAAKAEWSKDTSNKNVEPRTPVKLVGRPGDLTFPEKYPLFQGALAPDITFLCFDLPLDEAKGSQSPGDNRPGWFFILQQQPTEPRFGLDETPPPAADRTGTWRDLSWKDVKLATSKHIKLAAGLESTFTVPATPANVTWGSSTHSAAIGFITLQGPFRIAIHATDLLPS